MQTLNANDLGLTHFVSTEEDGRQTHLRTQLTEAGIAHDVRTLNALVSWSGAFAELVGYTSPNTHQPVTVLICPWMVEGDYYGWDYYTFAGTPIDELASRDPIALFDAVRAIVKEQLG